MLGNVSVRTREGLPGPDWVWAMPLSGLFLFGLAIFYQANDVLAATAFLSALFAAVARIWFDKLPAFLFGLFASVLTVNAMVQAYEPLRQTEFNFGLSHMPIPKRHLPPLPSIRDLMAEPPSHLEDPHDLSSEELSTAFSGHVQIITSRYRRGENGAIKCDANCKSLLGNPAVTAVTISPAQSWLGQGPKVVVPGYIPTARTFAFNRSDRCVEAFYGSNREHTHQEKGHGVKSLRQVLGGRPLREVLKDREPCYSSMTKPNDAGFDSTLDYSTFE